MENLAHCSYFELPVFITSQVMGLRSSHSLLSISVATHKMASPSHWVWIGYRVEKTSPWIQGKNRRSFVRVFFPVPWAPTKGAGWGRTEPLRDAVTSSGLLSSIQVVGHVLPNLTHLALARGAAWGGERE